MAKSNVVWVVAIIAVVVIAWMMNQSKDNGVVNIFQNITNPGVQTNVNVQGTTEQQHQNQAGGTLTCQITTNKNIYNAGDIVQANLKTNQGNVACTVGINKDSAGWVAWGDIVTDSTGTVTRTGVVNDKGTYLLRAVCGNCITNLVEAVVI